MKPREFWIKRGFLDPKEGVVRLTEPTDYSAEYFVKLRECVPLDWEKIWQAYVVEGGGYEIEFELVEKIIEKYLAGEE